MTFKRKLVQTILLVAVAVLMIAAAAVPILWQEAQARAASAGVRLLATQVGAQLSWEGGAPSTDQLIAAAGGLSGEGVRLLAVDPRGRVLADTAGELSGSSLGLPSGLTAEAAGPFPPVGRIKLGGQAVFLTPVPPGRGAPETPDGLLLLAVPAAGLLDGWQVFLPRLLLSSAVAFAVALLFARLAGDRLSAPLAHLANGARAVIRGDYDSHVPVSDIDEIRVVGEAFNSLAADVRAARQAQREFFANVSHDLRTPLNSIQGYSQALMDGALQTEEQRQRVAGIISAEAERLSRLMQGLLDLARIQAGRFSINQRDLDVNALLESCCARLSPQAQAVGVELDVRRPRRSLPIRGDAERLDQVLANLVDNVLARTRDGGQVQVRASLGGVRGLPATTPGNGNGEGANGKLGRWWVEVVVKENSSSPAGQQMVFTQEQEGSPEHGEDGANLGLGLTIAREIVVAHGGDLLVHSAPGAGTEFTVRLPMNVSN